MASRPYAFGRGSPQALSQLLAVVIPKHSRPKESLQRVERLLQFFAGKRLSDINGDLCRAFVRARSTSTAARDDLSLLRAAINFHCEERHCEKIVSVVLPEKPVGRERWMTRSEAARLIWAAWRFREAQKGVPTDRYTRRHVARFILVALYTGTRASAVCAALQRFTTSATKISVGSASLSSPLESAGIRDFFTMIFKAYPDFHVDVTDPLVDGLKGVSVERVTGTWRGGHITIRLPA
jgi:hypothetical protein